MKPDYKKKLKKAISLNIELVEIMDEYLERDLGNFNRSKYIEKLITEDLKKREIKIKKEF
jgi:metal-responsive CopG/Arc/MetJ family transcriptional regulator